MPQHQRLMTYELWVTIPAGSRYLDPQVLAGLNRELRSRTNNRAGSITIDGRVIPEPNSRYLFTVAHVPEGSSIPTEARAFLMSRNLRVDKPRLRR